VRRHFDGLCAKVAGARPRSSIRRRPYCQIQEADAEALPFADGTFDAVVSTFGVTFTPNQNQAAAELLRVCKSGGKIGLANWTPDGFIGQVFKTLGKYTPPPAGVKSPALWGIRDRLVECLDPQLSRSRLSHATLTPAIVRRIASWTY
jgi:ubiquinone/menaquinone biosynthesis C-methylase UbiE